MRDHRLCVLFPVPYSTEQVKQVALEGTFAVQLRPIAQPHPENVADWIEEFKQAYKTNLLEERQNEIALLDANTVEATLQTGEIATFLFM